MTGQHAQHAARLMCADAATPTLAVDREPWMDAGLCTQVAPDTFFPEKGESTSDAKRICRACEVTAECLTYALEHDERDGVWGATSPRERRRMRRGEPLEQRPTHCPHCGLPFLNVAHHVRMAHGIAS